MKKVDTEIPHYLTTERSVYVCMSLCIYICIFIFTLCILSTLCFHCLLRNIHSVSWWGNLSCFLGSWTLRGDQIYPFEHSDWFKWWIYNLTSGNVIWSRPKGVFSYIFLVKMEISLLLLFKINYKNMTLLLTNGESAL